MMLKMLSFLSFMMSALFINMNHPLSLGLILIFQTIIMILILGVISQTFWFSYILFLVIIGGMLIIFIYIISLIFNKMFIQNFNIYFFFTIMLVMMLMSFYLKPPKINSMESFMNYTPINEISLNLIKLYNFPMNLVNLMMITYLFFLLIVVVKITNFFYGPLRMKM